MKVSYLSILSMLLIVLGGCAHASNTTAVIVSKSVIIDVRTEAEWKTGHLEGAVLIPHDRIEQGIVSIAPDKKSRVYLYCRTGRRTGIAFDVLKKAGYEDLVNLNTLEQASKELHLPIVK